MGSFVNNKLVLEPWEEAARMLAITNSGSPSPTPFKPIFPVPSVYTHVGHAAQYGLGRRNGRSIRMIVLHITDVDSSALGAASYDARRSDLVSATAFLGPNGEIVYDVAEENRSYTTQRWNDESLAVEIIGHDEWTVEQWRARPLQMEGLTRLLVDWCKRYLIPVKWLTPTLVAHGASKLGTPPVQGIERGITDHLDANLAARLLGASVASTSHVCVGPGLRQVVWNEVFTEVRRRLGAQPAPIPQPTPPNVDAKAEEDMPFIVKKSNGETAVIYGSGKMTGLAGSDIPGFEQRFGPALLVAEATWNDFVSKGKA